MPSQCCHLFPPYLYTVDATVTFTQTLYTSVESELSATVCAAIEGNLAQDVVVTITTQSITAQGGFCMYKNTYICCITYSR